jgi:thiol:disulfide interchange protein DsbD
MFKAAKAFVLNMGLYVFALTLAGLSGPASAAVVDTGHVKAELIVSSEAVPGGEVMVALRQTIAKDWHTYWRNPGDAGQATTLDWRLPKGWQAGQIIWPTPKRLPLGTLMNYGYEGEVLLPVSITVPADAKPGQRVSLKSEAGFLVCKDICIPEQASLTVDVVVAAGTPKIDARAAKAISDTLTAAPKLAGLKAVMARDQGAVKLSITGAPLAGGNFPDAYFFAFDSTLLDHAKPQLIERGPQGLTLTLPAGFGFKTGPAPTALAGVIDLGSNAYEIEAKAGEPLPGAAGLGAPTAKDKAPEAMSLPLAVLFAFLGGLILNLMPCVFPILSMKAAALTAHGGNPSETRAQGLAFLAGVVATFLALAGALIAAKAAGAAVGWGFQLQSPPVVAVLCLVMLLTALNLSGLFEVGAGLQGAAGSSSLAARSGLAGAFFTGVLAVVVAAPCTAPFMAGAIGFALTQGTAAALLIFLFLGLGLAAPFTALAFSPSLTKRLPRPGLWMERLKQALAFPLYGTAAWLAWVFALQAGTNGLAFLLAASVAVAFAAWLYGLAQRSSLVGGKPRLSLILALLSVLAAGGLIYGASKMPAPVASTAPEETAELTSEPFSPERLAALRAEGRPVLINFTAAWCITCQVNDRAALSRPAVAALIKSSNAVYMVGDWTNRDGIIAKALAEQGRAGVPLYLVYGVGGRAPVILPQLLTEGAVIEALEAAAKPG